MMMMSSVDNRDSFGFRYRSEYEEFSSQVREANFIGKLRIDGPDDGFQRRDFFESDVSDQRREEEEEDDEEELEFSFASVNPDGSPISADDVFQDGRIRLVYPLFGRSLLFDGSQDETQKTTDEASTSRPPLKKLFVEMAEPDELDGVDEGTYCVWNGKNVKEAASREVCRKSNSTGSSRLWRFRDLVRRSSSDGKDAFVFLGTHRVHGGGGKVHQENKGEEASREKAERTAAGKEGKAKSKETVTAAKGLTAHEKHYVRSRAAKQSDRRKSYLPYRQDLVGLGFFANVSGMSRNVHPL